MVFLPKARETRERSSVGSLGRRRGTTGSGSRRDDYIGLFFENARLVFIVLALAVTVFFTGLIVGSHAMWKDEVIVEVNSNLKALRGRVFVQGEASVAQSTTFDSSTPAAQPQELVDMQTQKLAEEHDPGANINVNDLGAGVSLGFRTEQTDAEEMLNILDNENEIYTPNEIFRNVDIHDYLFFSNENELISDADGKSSFRFVKGVEMRNNDNGGLIDGGKSGTSFAISLWVYLALDSLNDVARSRTIISDRKTPQFGFECDSEPHAMTSKEADAMRGGGVRLFVNSPGTEDQSLNVEYIWRKGTDMIACTRLTALGYQIPVEEWTHVTLSFGKSVSLFLNGIEVAIDSDVSAEKVAGALEFGKENNKTPTSHPLMVGVNTDGGDPLHGVVAMMIINLQELSGEDAVQSIYNAGTNKKRVSKHLSDGSVAFSFANADVEESGRIRSLFEETSKSNHPLLADIFHGKKLSPPVSNDGEQESNANRHNKFRTGEMLSSTTERNSHLMDDKTVKIRREAIKDAMSHAWNGYKDFAWGRDELMPITKGGRDSWGGLATTLVDSLDTLWLMGMKEEFSEARNWVRDKLSFVDVTDVSVFETTIRNLGGLLSAYDLSGDQIFMDRADELGARLLNAFESKSGIPYGRTVLNARKSYNEAGNGEKALLSELGTLQLEFRHLTALTGKEKYADKANSVLDRMGLIQPENGLFPVYIENDKGIQPIIPRNNRLISFGAKGDSFYEYLLKVWLQGGKKEMKYREMYDKAIDGLHRSLLQSSSPSGLTYIAEMRNEKIIKKMDHLVCCMGGVLALGAYTDPNGLESDRAQRDLKTGKALTYTCYQMYSRMPTGLSPEFVYFDDENDFEAGVSHYLLRPEAVESFFILNYLTGDPAYREWGWEVFQAIERYCKTEVAFGSYPDVTDTKLLPKNELESFFFAETLKYLYLLYDPDTEIDILKKNVFNTEAHPLKMSNQLDDALSSVG